MRSATLARSSSRTSSLPRSPSTSVSVNTTTGIATLAGTAKCSANGPERGKPNSLPLRVKLTQEQKVAGKTVVVYAVTGMTVNCGLTTSGWSVPLTAFPYDKQWKGGAAVAQLETDPEATPEWIKPVALSANVKVSRPRK